MLLRSPIPFVPIRRIRLVPRSPVAVGRFIFVSILIMKRFEKQSRSSVPRSASAVATEESRQMGPLRRGIRVQRSPFLRAVKILEKLSILVGLFLQTKVDMRASSVRGPHLD